jgi:hypothetical protein
MQQGQPLAAQVQQGCHLPSQAIGRWKHPLSMYGYAPSDIVSANSCSGTLSLYTARYLAQVQQLLGSVVVATFAHGMTSDGTNTLFTGYTVTGHPIGRAACCPKSGMQSYKVMKVQRLCPG